MSGTPDRDEAAPARGPDPARASLDARVLAWMREPIASGRPLSRDAERFDALARALFAFQFERCTPYRRFCEARGRTPANVEHWNEIPAVPTGAFKELELRSFSPALGCHVFRTSGTATEQRGALYLDTLALYEASLLPSFRRGVLPDLAPGARVRMRVLAPSPAEAPDSSLSHMFGCVLRAFGDDRSGFDVWGGVLGARGLRDSLESACHEGVPVVLCGTAFAFVHLLDSLAVDAASLSLPPGSRVMETGGFKGRSRTMPRAELVAGIESALGVPPSRIVNQYGMTELGSQFYDSLLCDPGTPRRKLTPPWARVRIVDPESGQESAPGVVGLVEIVDLANTGSVLAIQTADLGRTIADGFDVLGRQPDAEARGCSIAADGMLEA